MNNMINYKIQKQTRTIIDNITNKNVVELAEQNGLNTTNWLDTIKELNHEPDFLSYGFFREKISKILCDIAVKYAEPDVFAKNISLITCKFLYADVIRGYLEQRIKKTNEQLKFLDRCFFELDYWVLVNPFSELEFERLENTKQVIEFLHQTLSTTATQAQLPNASEQTPQVTNATLTDGNKYAIKEIVQKFNNDDAFKGRFDEQQIIECVEHADFSTIFIDGQKKWVRGLICAIKSGLSNIDDNIFTQIAKKLGYTNMSEFQKSVKKPLAIKLQKINK